MNNLIIYIHCILIDLDDVQVQINTIVNQILFELSTNDFRPSYSVNYYKDGLVITINDLEDLMESCEIIVNNLHDYGWLGSVIKIELNDLLSDRSAYLIPKSSSVDDKDALPDLILPNNNRPYSNFVNFN
ncbi:MAG: hypothetical protein HND52_12670 [Ignavibacteriae bacterium]|nr:hypothetical protein [Ignavibacteriota bacterium]NOG98804.1 hypothetical protein [Ignavibacteriota bacterium]